MILGEIGVDVSKFPTEKHFASWLGLCPNHQASNHKLKSRRVRKGKNRVAIALRMAVPIAAPLALGAGAFLRRMQQPAGYQRGHHGHGTQKRPGTCTPCSSTARRTSARVWQSTRRRCISG